MLDDVEDLDQQKVPDKVVDDQETKRMIMDLVDALPPEQRMCVLFYYYAGMSVKEIAQTLEISEGTVKSRLNYARKAVKAGVDQYESETVSQTPEAFTVLQPRIERFNLEQPAHYANVYFEIPVFDDAAGGYAVINEVFQKRQEAFFSPNNSYLADILARDAEDYANGTGSPHSYYFHAILHDCTEDFFSVTLIETWVSSGGGVSWK